MTTPAPTRKLSKLHFALAMLVPVYPLITTILYIVLPLTEGWTIWQRTAVIAPIMVFSIVFFVSPFVQKRFSNFILRAA
jgi:antibiotic biosynthesis monooxygenase (ABM) superfamily enzyme